LPGLGEHRAEGDDVVLGDIPADRAVGAAAIDDVLDGLVDLLLEGTGGRLVRGGPPCSDSTSSLRWLIAASIKICSAWAAVGPLRPAARALASTRISGGGERTVGPRRTSRRTSQGGTMLDQPEPIPADDLSRDLTIARPGEDPGLPHIGLVGDTYTILVAGRDTAGKYTLIDMHVPPGGGPPPHRHDFEEMFIVLDGEVQVTFRGQARVLRAGQTVNVPANAPHAFTNTTDRPSRLLCLCAPAGQDEFFTLVGQPVATRTQPPPPLGADEQAAFIAKSRSLAPQFRTELLPPGDN
jgi:quercetin dioxygenase-like cupin family protein